MTRQFAVGDKVYIVERGSFGPERFTPAFVFAITKSGMIDIKYRPDNPGAWRYNPDLGRRGVRYGNRIDTMDFEERTKLIERDTRLALARNAILEIALPNNQLNRDPQLSELIEALRYLEGKFIAAKDAVRLIEEEKAS